MRNNNYLSLINFKVKTSSSETFKMNWVLYVQFFFNVVNLVSRGVLERFVGYCNHGATWGV